MLGGRTVCGRLDIDMHRQYFLGRSLRELWPFENFAKFGPLTGGHFGGKYLELWGEPANHCPSETVCDRDVMQYVFYLEYIFLELKTMSFSKLAAI